MTGIDTAAQWQEAWLPLAWDVDEVAQRTHFSRSVIFKATSDGYLCARSRRGPGGDIRWEPAKVTDWLRDVLCDCEDHIASRAVAEERSRHCLHQSRPRAGP